MRMRVLKCFEMVTEKYGRVYMCANGVGLSGCCYLYYRMLNCVELIREVIKPNIISTDTRITDRYHPLSFLLFNNVLSVIYDRLDDFLISPKYHLTRSRKSVKFNSLLWIIVQLSCLVWFPNLMAHQTSCITQCQIHHCKINIKVK